MIENYFGRMNRMKSMTGFGRGEFRNEKYECIIEIKTINHRYKDFFIYGPRYLNSIEDKIKKLVSTYVARGRIEISIRIEALNQEEKGVKLDLALAKEYYRALKKLTEVIPELQRDINLSLIARFPEIIKVEETEYNVDELWEFLKLAMEQALIQLDRTRREEGENLKKDLLTRCKKIEEKVKLIEQLAPEVEKEYKKRLTEKIVEYTKSVDIDYTRIMTEAAIFADKSNITEEIVRLFSHIQQFKNTLNKESIGRKLDFIVQEMNREANTIGSKGNHYSVSTGVVEIKSELEKIREQVQNIE